MPDPAVISEPFAPHLATALSRIVIAQPRYSPTGKRLDVLQPEVVADGAVWPTGHVVVHWPGQKPGVIVYDTLNALRNTLADTDASIHWIDASPDMTRPSRRACP